jgi:hypothetical protein
MKKEVVLRKFEYSIPLSTMALEDIHESHVLSQHLPLMKVGIDFETGSLKLEGNWRFMLASNDQNDVIWFNYHKERVEIVSKVYSSLPINLNDVGNDGLVFPLEGKIKDGNCLISCTGLLVFDSVADSNRLTHDQWVISFYLYIFDSDDCEIRFKLPVYINALDERYN